MGILNVTPDSFADGGRAFDPDAAVDAALRLEAEGADLIDIGGESTRPGAAPIDAAEELRRVVPVFDRLRGRVRAALSIDTYKAVVAERALSLGAQIVNDVSALAGDPDLAGVVARRGAAVVLMHHRGGSADMYARAQYGDVVAEVAEELQAAVDRAARAGIAADRIILDPGLGFAKRAPQTLELIARAGELARLDKPLLFGPSRKSFLRAALGDVPVGERLWGTAAAVAASILGGAHIVRVHDVAEMVQVAKVADALLNLNP